MRPLAHLGDVHTEVIGYGLACIAIVGLVVYDWVRRRAASPPPSGSAEEEHSLQAEFGEPGRLRGRGFIAGARRRRATRDRS